MPYYGQYIDADLLNGLPILDDINFNTAIGAPSHAEGLVFWDSDNKCLAYYNDEADVTHQVGQEFWIRVYNDSGGDILNGEIVYIDGTLGGWPTVQKARSDVVTTSISTLGFATHDIEDGTYGYITQKGIVHELNTVGYTTGEAIWLSPTTAGEYQSAQPDSPDYSIVLGNVGVVDGSVGTIIAHITAGNNTKGVINIINGSILEHHTFDVLSNGTTITATLEKTGGGDISLIFDGVFAPSQVYVALSRAKNMDGLFLSGFSRNKNKHSERALSFDSTI